MPNPAEDLRSTSLVELFTNLPPNLQSCFVLAGQYDEKDLALQETLANILSEHFVITECVVRFYESVWKFEKITKRNIDLQIEKRIKYTKCAPETEKYLGKRGGFVDDSPEEQAKKKVREEALRAIL